MITRWWYGDDEAALLSCAWIWNNSRETTHPVGQKRPNPWGLYDIHGNVMQWCRDRFDATYYERSPAVDPMPPPGGPTHVGRGGSRARGPASARCAFRYSDAAAARHNYLGFRVLQVLAE